MPFSPNAFDVVAAENSIRLAALQTYWSNLKNQAAPPPSPQPFVFLAGTGLLMVYAYSALEYCVTRSVRQLSDLIGDYKVRAKDVSPSLMCLVYNPQIDAVRSSGKRTRISKRLELFGEICSPRVAQIHDEFLAPEMQNVWAKSIHDIFGIFGIRSDPMATKLSRARIDQLVDDRNAVAHGREPPEVIGSKYSIADVDTIIQWLATETAHIIECCKVYYEDRDFIASMHRGRYLRRDRALIG